MASLTEIVAELREAHKIVPRGDRASVYSDAADMLEALRAAGGSLCFWAGRAAITPESLGEVKRAKERWALILLGEES